MQKKKIFIEINVPSQMRKRLIQIVSKWQNLPVKWLKSESLHITVAFVGYVDESVIPDICDKVNTAVAGFESFDLDFSKIELGPNENDPKMIWLTGEPNVELGMLNEHIERILGMRPTAHKEFRPHITLGKIRKLKWDEMENIPQIAEKIRLSMTVDSVAVMESKGGAGEYTLLEECPLQ